MKCERVQKAIYGFIVWRRRRSSLGMGMGMGMVGEEGKKAQKNNRQLYFAC